MKKRIKIFVIGVIGIMLISLFSCEKDSYYTNADATLNFSMDTVSFDTVFTTIGSATLYFTVRNPYSDDLEINSISLAGGDNSNFRINVDGDPSLSISDKLLRAKDSMYIFVDVNVDPKDESLPFLIKDSIVFNINGTEQRVLLQAYGQDAYHIKLGEWGPIAIQVTEDDDGDLDTSYFVLLNHDTTLTADKPYYLHNSFVVDSNVTLTLEPGVKFYIAKNKSIYVMGSIQANGTADDPIVFRGHRLDKMITGTSYDKVPGQWGVISLQSSSFDNEFSYTNIRNGLIGLYVDSLSINDNPKVKLNNCRIENMTASALYGINAEISAENCLFANCEQCLLYGYAGGKYDFTNCTFGNYYTWGSRRNESVALYNYYYYNSTYYPFDLEQANFTNCIIYGSQTSELLLSNTKSDKTEIAALFNYNFDHCLIKTDVSEIDTTSTNFSDVIWNKDPLFIEPKDEWDFHPDTLSPVINMGKTTTLTGDIEGNAYIGLPDIGAFEYLED